KYGEEEISTASSLNTNMRKVEQNGAKQSKKEYISLKVGFYNINRLKLNANKLQAIVEWSKEESFDAIGLAETNILEKEGHWINIKHFGYHGFWMNKKENKSKVKAVFSEGSNSDMDAIRSTIEQKDRKRNPANSNERYMLKE
ncbi:31980_t:CDS:2, partial [Gigaspora margarita]